MTGETVTVEIKTNMCRVALAFLFAVATLHTAQSATIEIRNCTGAPVKLEVRGSSSNTSARISSGKSHKANVNSPRIDVRIFEDSIVDTLKVSAPKMQSAGAYSAVRLPNGRWQLVSGNAC